MWPLFISEWIVGELIIVGMLYEPRFQQIARDTAAEQRAKHDVGPTRALNAAFIGIMGAGLIWPVLVLIIVAKVIKYGSRS